MVEPSAILLHFDLDGFQRCLFGLIDLQIQHAIRFIPMDNSSIQAIGVLAFPLLKDIYFFTEPEVESRLFIYLK
jgi:hypothetical protein